MIKFFRKIRQGLLIENKISKYLIYALGEILLVVIGILIALEINNSNTQNQETKELHGYLNNIKKNIQDDLVRLEEISVRRDSSISYSKKYIATINKNEITYNDFEEMIRLSYRVFRDVYYESNGSGFEALKNSGFLRKLQSTVLEDKINEYYYVVAKISEGEHGLMNTLENLEITAYNENIRQQIFKIESVVDKESLFSERKIELIELFNHPSITGANYRNSKNKSLPIYYIQLEALGKDIITEIVTTVNN